MNESENEPCTSTHVIKQKIKKRKRIRKVLDVTCDEFVRSAVHRKIHSFYANNELPTLKKVLTAINTDSNLSNLK